MDGCAFYSLGYVFLAFLSSVTSDPSDKISDCSAQLQMPCNVALKDGTFSEFGQQWDGSGGVSAPINFTSSYKCGSSDEYVLHLEWKPRSDVSFDILTGYAIDIRQEYNEFDEDGFDKFHLMFTVNNSEYVGKAYKVDKLDFSYDLPGVLISGWVYTIILYSLPIGPGNTQVVKEVNLIQEHPCSGPSSSSIRQVATQKHGLPSSEIPQPAPPFDVGWSVGFGVLACVVVIAVVAMVAVVYRLRVRRRDADVVDVEQGEQQSVFLPVPEQSTQPSLDSGIGQDQITEANNQYGNVSLNSSLSSFVPVTYDLTL